MPGAPTPQLLPQPIGAAANPSFITEPMPDSAPGGSSEAAGIDIGFPPITMQNELAGGKPPDGQDMNGFLFLISSHTMWVQCGQLYTYNSTLATDIGGYLAGTVLGMTDGTGMWLNLVNGNTNDPDAGGSGWVPLNSYGFTQVTITGGTTTLTAAQSKYGVIVLNGLLTTNAVVAFPQNVQEWLIINNTTGSHTVTAKAGSGTTQTVPQSGFSAPLGVYSIGDGNLYPTVAPLSVPIDQSPTPLTLVERTSAGYVTAVYFNQNSSLENPTVGAVFVQNSAADGYLRKISIANFISQLISNGIFTNAALTGVPTAPTAAAGTSTTQIATTAFVNRAGSVNAAQGSYVTPFGIIIKWGSFALPSSGAVTVTFPVAFPNACYSVVTTQGDSAGYGYPFGIDTLTAAHFITFGGAAGGINPGTGYYIAIGH